MLLVLVIILLLIGAAVVGAIYSNFLVFFSSFNESENYHRAYYNSISALERAELVTKQRAPGYVGNGGWKIGDTKGWTTTDNAVDGFIQNFSYLSNEDDSESKSTVFRDINSRTTRIPKEGEGNVEAMLAYNDPTNPSDNSNNYNMMDYDNSQIFLLYYDNSGGNPYTKISCKNGGCTDSNPTSMEGIIRLPKNINNFGLLDSDNPLTANSPGDDAIVDWQIRGRYSHESKTYPFNIFATQSLSITPKKINVITNKDSAIRESDINNNLNFNFSAEKRSPTSRGNNATLTIISPQEDDIKNQDVIKNQKFLGLFSEENNPFSEKQLRFSLLNLLQTKDYMIYPFLEYYINFGADVSDRYFKINAEGAYDDYRINTIVWKPTNKESVLGNFTTIF